MHTTKDFHGIPRLLVRISGDAKRAMTQKEIITNDGQVLQLCTKAPSYEEVDKYELSVCFGKIVGLSVGCDNYRVNDLVMLDYIVDCDQDYFVFNDGDDKIVCVPCHSRLHDKDIMATTYGKWEFDSETKRPVKFHYTGEKNQYIAKPGDLDQLSLILGVVRNNKIIPEENHIFCEKKKDITEFTLQGNIYAHAIDNNKCEIRKVLFSNPRSPIRPGMTVYAVKGCHTELKLFDQVFDIIPFHDTLAYQEGDQ